MRRWIFLFGVLVVGLSAHGAEPAGTRIMGMGGTGAALPEEAATVYWNPAGLYFFDRLASDFTFQFAEFGWPENWGISYSNYSTSRQSGAGLGVYRQKLESPDTLNFGDAVLVQLASVYLLPLKVPLGFSAKYINENWEDGGRKNYFSMDIGTGGRIGGLYLGASVQSVTRPNSRIFPYRVLGGASFELGDWATIAVQAAGSRWQEVEDLDPPDRRAGVELAPFEGYSFQAGRRETAEQKFWTMGFGMGSRRGLTRLYVGYQLPDDDDGEKSLFISYVYSP